MDDRKQQQQQKQKHIERWKTEEISITKLPEGGDIVYTERATSLPN